MADDDLAREIEKQDRLHPSGYPKVADQVVFGPWDQPPRDAMPPYEALWWQCSAGHQTVKWCGKRTCWLPGCGEPGMPADSGFVTHKPAHAVSPFPGGAACADLHTRPCESGCNDGEGAREDDP